MDKHIIPLDIQFYNIHYNSTRRAKLMLFSSILSKYDIYINMDYNQQTELITKIERSCYNASIEEANKNNILAAWNNNNFCDIYHSNCYKISSNMEIGGLVNNPNVVEKIISGELSISDLPNIPSSELFPQKYEKIKNRIEISKNVSKTVKVTSKYTCKKCKKSECTEENLYNRSLDEGVNVRITCNNCGHKWNG